MPLKPCIKSTADLNDDDVTSVLDSFQDYVDAGLSQTKAAESAVDDVIATVESERKEWLDLIKEQHPKEKVVEKKPVEKKPVDIKRVEKLRKIADGMEKQIDSKINPAAADQNPTQRRSRIIAGMRAEGEKLQRIQGMLYNMADQIEADTLSPLLEKVNTKIEIETLLRNEKLPTVRWHPRDSKELFDAVSGLRGIKEDREYAKSRLDWREGNLNTEEIEVVDRLIKAADKAKHNVFKYSFLRDSIKAFNRTKKLGIKNDAEWVAAREALTELTKEADPAQEKAKTIDQMERDLIGQKIPGFFPTPDAVIERMLDEAQISQGERVLEPSAGNGAIMDAIESAETGAELEGLEVNFQLKSILEAKDHKIIDDDFMEYSGGFYDKIVMNPPFEKNQDIEHVLHAYGLLKPGGRIVAIMSEHPFFANDKQSKDFRDWLDGQDHTTEKLTGEFKKGKIRVTGVNSRLVVINKETGKEAPSFSRRSFKQKGPRPAGISAQAAREVISEFTSSFKNDLNIQFRVYRDKKSAFGEDYAKKHEKDLIRGAYYPKSRKVALIASDLANKSDAMMTLRHEIIGHHGLNLFPADVKQGILDAVSASRQVSSLKNIWNKVDKDYAAFDETKRAEEVIARIAESKQGRFTKAWAAIVTAIRKALRAIGLIDDTVTKAELQDLINTMAEGISRGVRQQTAPATDQAQYARAYHGSPHQFDQFKTDKIGIGEGAQAYGHGLYFAESPGVAKSYQMSTTPFDPPKYTEFDVNPTRDRNIGQAYDYQKIGDNYYQGNAPVSKKEYQEAWEKSLDNYKQIGQGHLYEIDIPDSAIDNMLDWDKALSEQPEILEGIKDMYDTMSNTATDYKTASLLSFEFDRLNKDISGENFYRKLADMLGSDADASLALSQEGVQGIKYFDQVSRAEGEGTRNLVVFDDSIITILNRNGEPVENQEQAKADMEDVMFSRTTGEEDTPANRTPGRKYTPEQLAAFEKGKFGESAAERARSNPLKRALGNARDAIDESKQVWKTILRQGFLDQYDSFRTIINDKRAWMMANLSESSGGAIEAALEYGHPFMNQGAVDVDDAKKSLSEVLEPLGEEVHDWLKWIAGNRAERLATEDRERLFEDVDIQALKSLNQGKMANGKGRKAVYEQVRTEFEELNDAIVKIGVDTGIISKINQKTWKEQGFYVPFYRLAEEAEGGDVRGPYTAGGLVRQTAYKRLKGADIPLGDLLTNVIMNWNHVVSAGLKNQAATTALETAEDMELAEQVEEKNKSKDAIFIRIAGNKLWYELDQSKEGQLILESLMSLNYNGLNNFMMKTARKFKRLLTYGVTASPEFKTANLVRDSVQAIAVADMSTQIHKNLLQGFRATKKGNPTIARMIAGGGAFGDSGYIHGSDPEALQRLVKKDIDRMTILDSPNRIQRMWDAYQDFGARLENVNRAANFEQDLSRGVDLLTANFNARDHLDFQRTGAFVSIRALAQIVPFLNARMQGLSKLGRSAYDPAQRKQFGAVVGVYAMASVLLYLYMKDDEDYEQAPQWERDTYHLFKIPGSDVMYRFPRPFEVGFMATVAERATEQMVNDKVHGELFFERLWHGLSETLSFNPIPQMVMPAVEVWANKNTFTNRQIESAGMKNLSPSERRRAWTSETAIAMSKGFDAILWDDVVLSPVQIEHLVNGYFGWIGGVTLEGIDSTVRMTGLVPSAPTRRIQDYTVVGRFVRTGPTRGTRYLTEFYENLRDAERAYADIRFSSQIGNEERAMKLAEKNQDVLALRKAYTQAQKAMSQINKKILMVRMEKMPADEKLAEIDSLNIMKNEIAKRIIDKTEEQNITQ